MFEFLFEDYDREEAINPDYETEIARIESMLQEKEGMINMFIRNYYMVKQKKEKESDP